MGAIQHADPESLDVRGGHAFPAAASWAPRRGTARAGFWDSDHDGSSFAVSSFVVRGASFWFVVRGSLFRFVVRRSLGPPFFFLQLFR